jgi:hypothetical protein
MLHVIEEDTRLVLLSRAACFQLAFERLEDRWGHSLGMLRDTGPAQTFGGTLERFASSVEADIDQDPREAPPCPTFQELHHDTRGTRHRIFLLGQFGRHHYSAVFEAREEAAGGEVSVEVTDRCPDRIPRLAGTYLLQSDINRVSPLTNEARWPVARSAELALIAASPARLLVQPAKALVQGTLVQIETDALENGGTRRWLYLWVWTNSAPQDDDP